MADILASITEVEVAEDGQLPAGFLFASIKNTGGQAATVNGVALLPGEAKSYPFVGKGYLAVPYVVNAATLRVLYIT